MAVGQEAGRALVGPLHGAAQRLRRVQDAGVFGIADVLHAEGAADIGGQDANLVVRHVEDFRQRHLVAGDALRRHLQRETFGRLVKGGQRHARLHRHHGDAGVDDIELGHMRCRGERRVDLGAVAIVIIERNVVRDVIVEQRRAGLGGFRGIGHGGQRLDVEFDGLRRIARLRQRFRDHKGDGIADKAHLVGRQRRTVGLQQRRAVPALQGQAAGEGAVTGRFKVLAGPDAEHARHRLGGGRADPLDDPVGMAGAHHPAIGLAGQGEIVGVFALATHQRVVFLAAHRLPHTVFLQCDSVVQGGGRRVILHRKTPEMLGICSDFLDFPVLRVPAQITHRITPDNA